MSNIVTQKIAGLDHLRALAITLVFLFHYRLFAHPAWIDTIGSFGWTGVDLFFVLSGYLISSQIFYGIEKGTFSLRIFFFKRFFRILPAYWAVLAIYFTIPVLREWESLAPLWKYLTFTQNLGLDRRYHKTFSHAWSLCIEEQFYFLLPLSVLLLSRIKASKAGAYIIAALFLLGFVSRLVCWNIFIVPAIDTELFGIQWFKWIYYPTFNRLDELLAGITIAAIFQYCPPLKQALERNANIVLFIGLILIGAAYMLCIDQFSFPASIFGYPLIAIAYGLVVTSSICAKGLLNRFSSKILSLLATFSYAIYLVHKMTIHLAQVQFSKLNIDKDSGLMVIISIVITLLGATLLHYSIEKPFLLIKEKLQKNTADHPAGK